MTELKARNKLVTAAPQVVEGYQNGATLKELSQLHGVSQGTVRNCLISQGVTLRPRGRRRRNSVTQEDVNNGSNE